MLITGLCQYPLKGHWRGYIYTQTGDKLNMQENYVFDVYIDEKDNTHWKAITVSKNNKSFYAKAYAEVDLNVIEHQLNLTEIRLLKNQNLPDNETCLMNCSFNLPLYKSNRRLKGSFTSNHFQNKQFCNQGMVFLEKQEDIVHWDDIEQEKTVHNNDQQVIGSISDETYKISFNKKHTSKPLKQEEEIVMSQKTLNIPTQNRVDSIRESPPCLRQAQNKPKYYRIIKFVNEDIPQDSSHVH